MSIAQTRAAWLKGTITLAIALATAIILILSVEGAYALFGGSEPKTSLAVALAKRLTRPGLPENALQQTPLDAYIHETAEIDRMLEEFQANGIYIGNTPYQDLASDEARLTYRDDRGVLNNKPNKVLRSVQLRSRVFKSYDPAIFNQLDNGQPWPAATREFVSRYGFPESQVSTDDNGDRITLPDVDAHDVVLLFGDSMGFGTGLSDDETVTSVLQRRFPHFRFINVSVPGSDTSDNLARAKDRLEKYGTRVKGLIYFFSESDIKRGPAAQQLIADLDRMLTEREIGIRVLVYGQFIYRTMPDVFRDNENHELVGYLGYKKTLISSALAKGFQIVDLYDLVQRFRLAENSALSGLALYKDHSHFSVRGTEMIAGEIAATGLFNP